MADQNPVQQTNTPYGDSVQNHSSSSAGTRIFILRTQNPALREQVKDLALKLHQQQVFFDENLENTLATLSTTNNSLKIDLDQIKKEFLHLKEENEHLREENNNLTF